MTHLKRLLLGNLSMRLPPTVIWKWACDAPWCTHLEYNGDGRILRQRVVLQVESSLFHNHVCSTFLLMGRAGIVWEAGGGRGCHKGNRDKEDKCIAPTEEIWVWEEKANFRYNECLALLLLTNSRSLFLLSPGGNLTCDLVVTSHLLWHFGCSTWLLKKALLVCFDSR